MVTKLLSELAKGTWSSLTAYTVGDIVDYISSSYICILNNTNQIPPNATYWAVLSKGINPKGAYDNGVDYAVGDYVSYLGSSYIMYVNAAAATLPTDTTKWQIVASKGDTGSTGSTGSQGIQGIPGTNGTNGTNGNDGADGADGIDGISFIWRGAWVTSHAYVENDVVSKDGSTYICLVNHTSGTFSTDLAALKWALMAQKGADGMGSGDMLAATYDPTNIAADAFSQDNMVDGTTNKNYSATEKTKLAGIAAGATNNTKATGAEVDTGTDDAKFVTAKAMEDSAYIKAAYADALVVDSIADSDTTHAPSRNAVFDALALKQPLDADLTTIAGLTATTDNFIVSVSSAWASRTVAQVKTTLALNNVDNTSNATERAASATLTNKTIDLASNTVTMTLAQLNTAVSDANIARTDAANTLVGVQTITNITLPTNGQVLLTVPTTDGHATGNTTNAFNCGYSSSAVGDLVYLDSSSTWQKCDANTLLLYNGLLGIALEVKAAAAALLVALPGSFVYATGFPTFTVGLPIYMSETAGAVTQTAPTTTDAASRIIGWGIHADKMYFYPSQDYTTHT